MEGVWSVTVEAANGARADALATALAVLGPEVGMALVERLPGVEAILVVAHTAAGSDPDEEYRVILSRGIGGRFERL